MAPVKRVVLRLCEAHINNHDLYEHVRLYLEKDRHSSPEIEPNWHFIRIQPPNPHIPASRPQNPCHHRHGGRPTL